MIIYASSRLKNATVQLLVTAYIVLTSLILITLKIEAICSSETSALTRTTRRHILERDILHSHRRENLKSYISSPELPGFSSAASANGDNRIGTNFRHDKQV
jgi:hypothetical protein